MHKFWHGHRVADDGDILHAAAQLGLQLALLEEATDECADALELDTQGWSYRDRTLTAKLSLCKDKVPAVIQTDNELCELFVVLENARLLSERSRESFHRIIYGAPAVTSENVYGLIREIATIGIRLMQWGIVAIPSYKERRNANAESRTALSSR